MEIIVFEEETYWKMQRALMDLFAETLKRVKMEASNDEHWVTQREASQILGYRSKSKWQMIRSKNQVKYSKYGRVIKYSKSSLYDFINKNIQK